MFGQAMNPVIRSDGSPKFAMASGLAGAAVNIILDPVFIYGFHWGMMGAAVATVLGQILTAAMAVWYLCHMKAVGLKKESLRVDWTVTKALHSAGDLQLSGADLAGGGDGGHQQYAAKIRRAG